MKTTATPQEVLAKTYLNITDIQTLLGMTREPARRLFHKVKNIEKEKIDDIFKKVKEFFRII